MCRFLQVTSMVSYNSLSMVSCAHLCSKYLIGPAIVRWLSPDGEAAVSASEKRGRRAMGTALAVVPCTQRTREGLLPPDGGASLAL